MSFLRIAHRGASGTRPEHTRAALERAIEIGVDMIEVDVQLTRDAQLVVLHDRELGRTVAGSGWVRDHDLADLCRRDAGAWFAPEYAGQRVLSLAEVLEITSGRVALNVEIKSPEPDWQRTAEELVALLSRFGQLDATIVSSFETGALRRVRAAAAAARLGILWHRPDIKPLWDAAREVGAASVHLHWALVCEEILSEAFRQGLSVLVWTVNDIETVTRLVRGGVSGIISDFPEMLGQVFQTRPGEKGDERP